MLTGWQEIGGNTYYFLGAGRMVTGTVTIDGKIYEFNKDGRLQTRTYENAQGQRVFVTEVVCDNIQFLESKSNNNQNTQNKHNNQGYARNQQTRQNVTSNIDSLQLNNELDDIGAYVLEDDIQF